VVAHQLAECRLALVAAVEEAAANTQLGLEKDMLVAVAIDGLDSCLWGLMPNNAGNVFGRIVDIDPWSCEYKVRVPAEKEAKPTTQAERWIPHNRVRPIFRESQDPQGDWATLQVKACRAAKRRENAEAARASVAGALLGLPKGQWVLETDSSGNSKGCVVVEYSRVTGSYLLDPWDRDRGHGLKGRRQRSSGKVQPVFWASEDPLADVETCLRLHAEELNHGAEALKAEEDARFANLGLPVGVAVRVFDENEDVTCRVLQYMPEVGEYRLTITADVAIESYSDHEQRRPCTQLRRCFLDEDRPLEAAVQTIKAHAVEDARIREALEMNAACAAGGLLDLKEGIRVMLVGDGLNRRPSEVHSGRGIVLRYWPDKRTYDVMLDTGAPSSLSRKSFCSSEHHLYHITSVAARHLAPLFSEVPKPKALRQELETRHVGAATCFSKAVLANSACRNANLGLPAGMRVYFQETSGAINARGTEQIGTIQSFDKFHQRYRLFCNTVSNGGCCIDVVPSALRPYVFEADDPAAESALAVAAHETELARLWQLEELEAKISKCNLNLPTGLPVRIVQAIPRSHATSLPKRPGVSRAQQLTAWLSSLVVAKPPGCSVGDIAYIADHDQSNSCYILAAGQLPQALPVWADDEDRSMLPRNWLRNLDHQVQSADASSLRPLLTFAEDPHAMAARLRQGHEAALRRAADQCRLLEQRPIFLGMPRGTGVSIVSSGRTATIRAYDASVPGYSVYSQQHGFFFVAVDQVVPDLSRDDNFESRTHELECLHEAEVRRLAEVRQANELSASWHFHLPIGTIVEVDAQYVPCGEGLLQLGTILGIHTEQHPNESTYTVALRSGCASGSCSNASCRTFPQQHVKPSFWEAQSPLQSARELQSRIEHFQKEP